MLCGNPQAAYLVRAALYLRTLGRGLAGDSATAEAVGTAGLGRWLCAQERLRDWGKG